MIYTIHTHVKSTSGWKEQVQQRVSRPTMALASREALARYAVETQLSQHPTFVRVVRRLASGRATLVGDIGPKGMSPTIVSALGV